MVTKTCTLVAILSIMIFLLISCGVNHDDEIITEYFHGGQLWVRESIDELQRTSTYVVIGEIIDTRVEFINTLLSEPRPEDIGRNYVLHTIYRIKVLEVFAGNTMVGDILEVAQKGGRLGNRELIYTHHTTLHPGNVLTFFLRSYEAMGFGHLPLLIEGGSLHGLFGARPTAASLPTTVRSGIFADGIVQAFRENHLIADAVFTNVNPNNLLVLTVADLVQIRADNFGDVSIPKDIMPFYFEEEE